MLTAAYAAVVALGALARELSVLLDRQVGGHD